MSRLRFKTIFGRMLFIQCTSCLLILLVAGSIIFLYLADSLYSPAKNSLVNVYDHVSASSLSGENDPDSIFFSEETDDELLFQIVTEENVRCYYHKDLWNDFAGFRYEDLNISRIAKKAGAEPSFTYSFFPKNSFNIISLFYTIENSGAIVLIHKDVSSVAVLLFDLLQWILIVCIIASLIICLVCFYLAKRVLDPIVDMNHAVKCYSRGDFSQRLPVTGKDEASQLAQSFNEMAEQLRNMDNSRKSFVANVSHELRSPLTSIKGFLEAMQDGTIPEEEHELYLGIVLSETRRMATMVNDLLDLARIESGMIKVSYETFDVNELIRRTLITFETLISDKQMELDVRFANEQCFVHADQAQISQVLRNLIDNAIKYSPEGRTLQLSTYSLRKEVYVSVKDTGIGIPSEDVPHIFDRFYKVEKAHTPSPQVGSGLGLSIVKKIIEAHGQSITVKSARGKGTQFTFTLQKASLLQIQSRGRKNEE